MVTSKGTIRLIGLNTPERARPRRDHPDPPRSEGRRYYRRKLAQAKTGKEALLCLIG